MAIHRAVVVTMQLGSKTLDDGGECGVDEGESWCRSGGSGERAMNGMRPKGWNCWCSIVQFLVVVEGL